MVADVNPIALFIDAYPAWALRRSVRPTPVRVVAATVGFALLGFALTSMREGLTGQDVARLTDGSIDCLTALLTLFGMAAVTVGRPEARFVGTGRRLTGIGVLCLISFAARTADQASCRALPFGTRRPWHLRDAAVLCALVATAIRHRDPAG